MNALLERLFLRYRATGIPSLHQQAKDLADAARADHADLEARLAQVVNNWRPTARGYEVREL